MRLCWSRTTPRSRRASRRFLRGQGDEVEVEDDGMRADRRLQDDG